MSDEVVGGPVKSTSKVEVVDGRAVNADAHAGDKVIHDLPLVLEDETEDEAEAEAEAE